MKNIIPFLLTDWDSISKIEFKGEEGTSYWRTLVMEGIRMRIVEYSEGFISDHWCEKGHILFCIEGEVTIKLKDDKVFNVKKGMSFIVSDNIDAHCASSEKGAKVFIIDGEFLK
jgi:quercetin dioxygenase-like cupin family protein